MLPRLDGPDLDKVTWVTFDTAQSRSLLNGQDVVFAAYPKPRDPVVSAQHALLAQRMFQGDRFSYAVSTGSSIAVPFLSRARLSGASCHYIESATRLESPSLTGRILVRAPGIHVYSQIRGWKDPPWHYRGSVFDGYRAVTQPDTGVARIVVATGSSSSYGFRSLIERLIEIVPAGAEVLWQTGSTPLKGLDISARPHLPSEELAAAMSKSDVVVTHAGVGLSLLALANGRCPVVVPRRQRRGEHIDDHQTQVASMLSSRGLALSCEVESLTLDVLRQATGRRAVREVAPPRFVLAADSGRSRHRSTR